MHGLAGQGVPETDASVCCSTTTAHGAVLVRRPSDGFDGSDMLAELCLGLTIVGFAPYHQFVVISSRGKLLLIWTPFEAANFLFVSFKLCKEVFLHSWIPMENALVSRPTAQERMVPSNASDPSIMSFKLSDHFLFNDVPVLEYSAACSHRQIFSIV